MMLSDSASSTLSVSSFSHAPPLPCFMPLVSYKFSPLELLASAIHQMSTATSASQLRRREQRDLREDEEINATCHMTMNERQNFQLPIPHIQIFKLRMRRTPVGLLQNSTHRTASHFVRWMKFWARLVEYDHKFGHTTLIRYLDNDTIKESVFPFARIPSSGRVQLDECRRRRRKCSDRTSSTEICEASRRDKALILATG